MLAARTPLADASNVHRHGPDKENVNPLKRSLFAQSGTPAKKPKLAPQSASPPRRASTGAFCDYAARGMAMRALRMPGSRLRPTPPSSLPSLDCLVSSITCDSYPACSDSTRALSLAYSHHAKRGGPPTLAAGTVDGNICIWEARPIRVSENKLPPQRVIHAHTNLIRDLHWSRDDQLIATASADHTARITSVTTAQCIRIFDHRQNEAPVNCISWDPNNDSLLCTVARDRQIRIWDLREDHRTTPAVVISPVFPATTNITSAIYLPHEPYSIVTSWSTDGILKKWDFRAISSSKSDALKPISQPSEESSSDPTRTSGRGRGLSSLLYNARTCSILGLAVNGRIHTYYPFLPAQQNERGATYGYGGANGSRNSFYVRLCESPCGRWVASGSTGFKAHVYDVASPQRATATAGAGACVRGVELGGHAGEVHGMDWASDGLALASDDHTVSVWRQDVDIARQCREDEDAQRWKWRWATREGSS